MLGGRSAECTQPSARARQRLLPSAPPSSSPRFLFTTSVIVVVFFGFIFSFICHNFIYLYSQPHCCSFSFIGTYCGPILFALSLDPIFLSFPLDFLSFICLPSACLPLPTLLSIVLSRLNLFTLSPPSLPSPTLPYCSLFHLSPLHLLPSFSVALPSLFLPPALPSLSPISSSYPYPFAPSLTLGSI